MSMKYLVVALFPPSRCLAGFTPAGDVAPHGIDRVDCWALTSGGLSGFFIGFGGRFHGDIMGISWGYHGDIG